MTPQSTSTFTQRERAQLCNLFDTLGPAASTLCAGWTTLDLAAHLVTRERRPDAAVGIVLKSAHGWTEKVENGKSKEGLQKLVGLIRKGPPKYTPFGLLDATLNTIEFFVHHEDVRRAQPSWQPRTLSDADEDDLWKNIKRGSIYLFKKVPVGLTLRRPNGVAISVKSGEPKAILEGPPSELILYLLGRKEHSLVEFGGEAAAIAALKGARFNI